MSSDAHHLAQMANDIGNFFRAQAKREDAVAGIANHISSFWTRRMRDKLITQMQKGDVGLDELPLEALRRLAEQHPATKPQQTTGGDAG
jgi:formate dehydrogenase subunit delta